MLSAILFLRSSYLVAASGVLAIFFIPPFRTRFLAYGARSTSSGEKAKAKKREDDKTGSNLAVTLLDLATSLTVPHAWFLSFYVVSLVMAVYWSTEVIYNRSALWQLLIDPTALLQKSMTFDQILVTWAMMLVQSGRRLYECLAFSTSSKSRMWIGHWMLGIWFYITINIAILIEGVPALQTHRISLNDFVFRTPSPRTFISVLIFLLATGFQHDCHAYLAHLKSSSASRGSAAANSRAEYKVPSHPAFQPLIAPHYTAECLIYLALAINAAPPGEMVNKTIACALVFVVVNLGVTAHGTKEWYEETFGPDAVRGKWRMIPFVY